MTFHEWFSTNLPIIISSISAIIAGGGLIFNGMAYRQNTNSRYLQVLTEFAREISNLESSQERNSDYDLWGAKYLSLHDRIAYLASSRIIPKNIARYFDANFAAALALLGDPKFKEYENGLDSLISWCRENGIKPSIAPKPHTSAQDHTKDAPH